MANTFEYNYSPTEQAEIKKIREKYSPSEESALDRLRRLDQGVTKKGSSAAIAAGVIGTLIMGLGMSLLMSDLADAIGIGVILASVLGVIAGVAGLVLVALAYPVYMRVTKKERERITPEILRLTDELLK